jgi:N,N'-diacetyllegionaminate synthase
LICWRREEKIVSLAKQPLLICEIANFHGGDASVIFRMMETLAPLSYPDRAIKFHPIAAEALATPDFTAFELYKTLGFDMPTWARIIETAHRTFGGVWLEMADANCSAVFRANKAHVQGVKFQASMVDNREVLASFSAAQASDPVDVMVNVSGYDLAELEDVIARMATVPARSLILQIGFQGYPTALTDTLFNKIPIIRARFPGLRIAFADHVAGGDVMARRVPLLAAALGCEIIEKHVCLDRANTRYDGWSALEPAELAELQDELAKLPALFGPRFVAPAERDYLVKSFVKPIASAPRGKGSLISDTDVIFRRSPQQGLAFSDIAAGQARDRLILARDVEAGRTLRSEDFRKARVAALVACRMKSSRLPQKALLTIDGVTSVERCLEGALAIKSADVVCLATSTHADDAVLAGHTLDGKVLFHRGDEDDVIRRYLDVCDAQDIDVICRITADCPTPSSSLIEVLLDRHFAAGADFTRSRQEAVGTGAHIINVEAMRRLQRLKGRTDYSEYMNLYFENNPEHFKINIVDLPVQLIRDYRLTLDYPEDLEMFRALFDELKRRGKKPDLEEIFAVLDQCPDIRNLNSAIPLKYKSDPELIAKLARVTRIGN